MSKAKGDIFSEQPTAYQLDFFGFKTYENPFPIQKIQKSTLRGENDGKGPAGVIPQNETVVLRVLTLGRLGPRHPVILLENDLGVQSPPQHSF